MVSYSACRMVAISRDHADPTPHRPWWWRLLGITYVPMGEMLGRFYGVAGVDHVRNYGIKAPLGINLIYVAVAWLWCHLKQPLRSARRRSARELSLLSACSRLRREVHAYHKLARMLAQDVIELESTAVRWIVIEPVPQSGTCCVVKIQRGDGSWLGLELVAGAEAPPHSWRVAPRRAHAETGEVVGWAQGSGVTP